MNTNKIKISIHETGKFAEVISELTSRGVAWESFTTEEHFVIKVTGA